jgi:hypothetical protein
VTANKGAGGWLDFFVICDDVNCHLFFTDDDGEMFRSQTKLTDFPAGFGDAVVAIQGVKETVFEGGMTYHIKGKDAYLTLVEAFGPSGNRFFRSFVSSSLDGVWDAAGGGLDESVRRQDERHVHGRHRLDGRHQPRRADPQRLRSEAGDRPDQPSAPLSGRGSRDHQPRILADPLEDLVAHSGAIMKNSRLAFVPRFASIDTCRFAFALLLAGAGCAADPAYKNDGGGSAGTGGSSGSGGGGGTGAAAAVPAAPATSRPAPAFPSRRVPTTCRRRPAHPATLKVLDWAGFKSAVTYTFDDAQPSQVEHYASS